MKLRKLGTLIVCFILAVVMALSMTACDNSSGGDAQVDSIDIQSTLAIDVGEKYTLQVSLEPFGVQTNVSWKSSNTSVATVDGNGEVKGIAQGSSVIRATAGGKSANCVVTVTDPNLATVNVTKVEFEKGVVSLDVDGSETLKVTITPENATDKTLTWKSNKPDIATVDNEGVVTAVAAGNAIITATAHNSIKATCVVKVAGAQEETTQLHVAKVDSLADRDDFIMGMDASAVPSLEAAGVKYKDFDGTEKDVYAILKDNGITDIRIRVWNYPYQQGHYGEVAYSYGGGNCDVENAVAIARRCQAAGLGVIIDFHYSDFWADPGKQYVPKAWKDLTSSQIETEIYNFTKTSLQAIAETNVKITMVQIGNETTKSICGADINSTTAAAYINAGSRAVREVTGAVAEGGAKVAIHLTNPGTRNFSSYAENFKTNNVDYDVLGSSYYPYYEGHGTLSNLATNLGNVIKNYDKEVMVLETSYAFSPDDFDGCGNTRFNSTTEPLTVQGQSNAIRSVIETIADLGSKGLGVCYWEGTWIAASTSNNRAVNTELCSEYGCGWASANAGPTSIGGDNYQKDDVSSAGGCVIDNQAFFTSDGTVLESLKVFKLAKEGQNLDPAADYLYDEEIYYTVDEGKIALPEKVKIVLNDGSVMTVTAIWDVDMSDAAEYIHTVGTYIVNGTTTYGGSVNCKVYVQNKNLLSDGGFEETDGYGPTDKKVDIPEHWQAEKIKTSPTLQLYVSNKSDDAEMGGKSFHFWDQPSVEFRLYQEVDLSKARELYGNGKYAFSVDFAGGDFDADQQIYAYAVITYNDGTEAKTIEGNRIQATGWRKWARTSVDEIEITANVASVKVGIYVKGETEAGPWGNIDNAQFFFKSAS